MGQTANLLTLRKHELNLNLVGSSTKSFLYNHNFFNSLKQSLSRKRILLTESNVNFLTNTSFLNLKFFFRTNKVKKYKLGVIKLVNKKVLKSYPSLKFNQILRYQFDLLKKNLTILQIENLNRSINNKIVKFFYSRFKRFTNILFSRRFDLFVDFLKLSSLFVQSKIKSSNYLYILGEIFRFLQKKKHNRFIFFLKDLFFLITKFKLKSERSIVGLKCIIHGKLMGKQRASFVKLEEGSVPIRSFNTNIQFSKMHIYTLYGVFGFNLWVNYSNTLKS